MNVLDHDDLLDRLRAERPVVEDRPIPAAVLASIVTRPPQRRRWVLIPSAAAAVVVAVIAATVLAPSTPRRETPAPVALDMQRIAAQSAEALRSGRAHVRVIDNEGAETEQRVAGDVEFAGEDLAMRLHFDAVAGRGNGFDAENRTVGGQFYLFDDGHWSRDTNASGARGSDLFNADPRTLLGVLNPAAQFAVVDTADGVRHLRAQKVDQLPALNLSLGPVDPKDVQQLDVWVGADDVVRRLEVRLLHVEDRPRTQTVFVRNAGGRMTKQTIPPSDPSDSVRVEIRTSYAVDFTDAGAAIAITAPAGAVDVAGKG